MARQLNKRLLLVLVPVFLAVGLGVMFWRGDFPWHTPTIEEMAEKLIVRTDLPFDQEKLFELEVYDSPRLTDHYQADSLIITYFSNLSCSTCVNRELARLNELHADYSQDIDFVVVVHGQHPGHLRSLKRVARVKYPILIEKEAGDLGLSEKMSLSFIDKKTGSIVYQYHPYPDPSMAMAFDLFRDRILEYLKARKARK